MVKNHILVPLVKDGSRNIWLRKCTGSGKASEDTIIGFCFALSNKLLNNL